MYIKSIKKVPTQRVYDITVRNSHHYILENGVITHNSGLKYAASTIVFLSKTKAREKDDDDKKSTYGAIIKIKTNKSRFTREDKQVVTLLDHSKGLNRYYGLLEIGAAGGLFEQVTKEKYKFPNGKIAFNHVIYGNPEEWFTKDILNQLDVIVGKIFKYGGENNDLLATTED